MRTENLAARFGTGNSLYGREIRERIAAHDAVERRRVRLASERHSAPAFLGSEEEAWPGESLWRRWAERHTITIELIALGIMGAVGLVIALWTLTPAVVGR